MFDLFLMDDSIKEIQLNHPFSLFRLFRNLLVIKE